MLNDGRNDIHLHVIHTSYASCRLSLICRHHHCSDRLLAHAFGRHRRKRHKQKYSLILHILPEARQLGPFSLRRWPECTQLPYIQYNDLVSCGISVPMITKRLPTIPNLLFEVVIAPGT